MPIALLDFAIPKWSSDDAVEIADAYKYLFQATMGGEHAAPDREAATAWLEREWNEMGETTANENTWETLCPDGSVGRLNLRPFKRSGSKQADLVDAFLASSREFSSDKQKFIAAWGELGQRLKKKKIGRLDHRSWQAFDREMKEKNYPAARHSSGYRDAKRPAYRVLTLDVAQMLIPN